YLSSMFIVVTVVCIVFLFLFFFVFFFFFQAEDGIRDGHVTGVQTCALPISSFASAVIREPLNGVAYDCPVGPETGVWLLSPRRVVEAFMHAHDLPASAWGSNRVVNLPGITVTVAGMIEAMAKIAGSQASRRVSWKP